GHSIGYSDGRPPECHNCGERDSVEECKSEVERRLIFRPNVWLGCSVSDQATADAMIPELLKCRDLTPVLFVSAEPLLGPIDLPEYLGRLRVTHERGIDFAIVGGESGPHARPCNLRWIRSIRDQCKAAGVPCFVKQLGSRCFDSAHAMQ